MTQPPFQAEPVEALKARFAAALEPIYDARDMIGMILDAFDKEDPLMPAIMQRKHIFDFPDYIRMIVSAETLDDSQNYLHLSFGIYERSPIAWTIPMLREKAAVIAKDFANRAAPPPANRQRLSFRALHYWFPLETK